MMHGGKSLKGIASPSYDHGGYSRYLPARLQEAYQLADRDPQQLELGHKIAMLEARLRDLLQRVDTGESGHLWRQLQAARLAYLDAARAGDTQAQTAALSEVLDLVRRGHQDYAAWHEVSATLDQTRRLIESERKRQVETQQLISSAQALGLLTALVEAIRTHVSDRSTLEAVQATYTRLTGLDSGAVIDVGPATAE